MKNELREKIQSICGLLRVKPEYNAESELLSLFSEMVEEVINVLDKLKVADNVLDNRADRNTWIRYFTAEQRQKLKEILKD